MSGTERRDALRLTPGVKHPGHQVGLACAFLLAFPTATLGLVAVDERSLSPGQAFHLRIEAGEVQVRPGDAGKAGVQADLAPGQRIVWRESTDRQVLIVDDSERLVPRPSSLRLAVPPDTPLVIHLGRATLDLQGVGGEHLVVRGGAGVRIVGAFMAADILVDGPVDMTLEDASGDVRAAGSTVRLVARGVSKAVSADALAGGIELVLDRPRRVRATSVAGPIALRLGEAADADVLLESLSGDLRVDLVDAWPGTIIPQLARGVFEAPEAMTPRIVPGATATAGGGRLVLRSFSGSVRVVVVPRPAGTANADGSGAPE